MLDKLNVFGKRLLCVLATAILPSVCGQDNFRADGTQYDIVGGLLGDQAHPQVAFGANGGFVVWDDNVYDGDGLGIVARRIDNTLSGAFDVFRVNKDTRGDQEKPKVALLANGGAAFVWQGNQGGRVQVYARFVTPAGAYTSPEFLVSAEDANVQADASVAGLKDGTAVVVWANQNRDGSMQGVFGQKFNADGSKIGGTFQINQYTPYNQRTPALTALSTGGFAVAWASEVGSDLTGDFDIGIYGRVYDAAGAIGNEFRVNGGTNLCANPAIAANLDGGFLVAWGESSTDPVRSWDVYARAFDGTGKPLNLGPWINNQTYGDQFAPKVAGGRSYLVTWTSMGQDGSQEGVYGRYLTSKGGFQGDEFRVNTVVAGQQLHPTVASDNADRYLSVWTSFVGGPGSFELFAQRYSAAPDNLPSIENVFASAVGQTNVSVAWEPVQGYSVTEYRVYVDDAGVALTTTNAYLMVGGFSAGTDHSFKVSYKLADDRISPVTTVAAHAVTWGADLKGSKGGPPDGLPDDWQTLYWGKSTNWPRPDEDSDGDHASNLEEFLAGTDPTDPDSVLLLTLQAGPGWRHLTWKTVPGMVYQLQVSTGGIKTWKNSGGARFARESQDSVTLTESTSASYYRVLRLR